MGLIMNVKRAGDWRYRMQLGLSGSAWSFTNPRTHTLVLGPSQGVAGKTSALLIPTMLSHYGPCLATTTKWDIPQATAMARGRLGDVYWYDPSGGGAPPGFKELRVSPVTGCENWTIAVETAHQIMTASETEHVARRAVDDFFKFLGAEFTACLLHFAAVVGFDMEWVIARIKTADMSKDGELATVERAMKQVPVAEECARSYIGILNRETRARSGGDVIASARVALRSWTGDALRVTKDVNFDPVAFVVGQPNEPSELRVESSGSAHDGPLASMGIYPRLSGRYDTIYVSLPVEKQRIYAPSLISLIGQIRRAAYAVAEHDQRRGWFGRMPTLLGLDEMWGSPIPDLPHLLAEGAGQNLLLMGALQDLSQAVDRWGEQGKGFLTLWPNVVAYRGLREKSTLDLLSELGGSYDHIKSNYSEIHDKPGQWSEGISSERRPWLPPEILEHGDPSRPGEELIFRAGGGWQYFRPVKYFSGFWAWVLVQSAEWTLKGGPKANHALPFPDLARGGDFRTLHATGGDGLVRWYSEVHDTWRRGLEAA
jgi:type IV secretion system protein VirD4